MEVDADILLTEEMEPIVIIESDESREEIRDIEGGISPEGFFKMGYSFFGNDIWVESVDRCDTSIISLKFDSHCELIQRIFGLLY